MTNDITTEDARLSFDDALAHVRRHGGAAFAVTPVFGDDGEQETAEGARVFILVPDEDGGIALRFIAGPFFSAAFAANESIDARDTPDSVRALRFLPTRCDEAWFTDQVQVLINKLVNAAGTAAPEMPDYLSTKGRGAGPEAVFPVSFIGKPH
jgi:hypothetical protein